MDRFLHITITYNGGAPREFGSVFDYLAPDWLRYAPNCYIIWTARPASDFLYALKPLVAPSDLILIVKIDMTDRNGWQPQWVWEWMDRRRQLGPPPPPTPPPNDLNALWNALALPQTNALSPFQLPPPSTKK